MPTALEHHDANEQDEQNAPHETDAAREELPSNQDPTMALVQEARPQVSMDHDSLQSNNDDPLYLDNEYMDKEDETGPSSTADSTDLRYRFKQAPATAESSAPPAALAAAPAAAPAAESSAPAPAAPAAESSAPAPAAPAALPPLTQQTVPTVTDPLKRHGVIMLKANSGTAAGNPNHGVTILSQDGLGTDTSCQCLGKPQCSCDGSSHENNGIHIIKASPPPADASKLTVVPKMSSTVIEP